LHLRRYEDQKIVPWRNGGGLTREIGVLNCAHSPSDILWRVSAATVVADGQFSRFDGIDRSIAVLAGNGLILRSSTDQVTLTTDSAPHSFRGETGIYAHNVDGPTIDLNVMTQRGRFVHSMSRLIVDQPMTILTQADVTMLVFGGEVGISAGGASIFAREGDALLDIAKGGSLSLSSAGRTAAFLLEISSIP
jgi:uncharacterized protein